MPGKTALIVLNIHKNDVRTDLADLIPGDHIIVCPAEGTKNSARSGHYDGQHLAAGSIDLHICHKSQPPSVTDADDFLTVQFCDPDPHKERLPMHFLHPMHRETEICLKAM